MEALVNRLNWRQTNDPYVDINLSYLPIASYEFCILSSRDSKLAHKSIGSEYCIHFILKTNLQHPLLIFKLSRKHILRNLKIKWELVVFWISCVKVIHLFSMILIFMFFWKKTLMRHQYNQVRPVYEKTWTLFLFAF